MNELLVAQELNITPQQVKAVAGLLDEGATVPFIARYRKEAHQSLDEVAIVAIRDRLHQLKELAARKQAILKSLDERGLLNEQLAADINAASAMSGLEDIYLPYRPKKRTRAMVAREKGLEALALAIFEQREDFDPHAESNNYIHSELGVDTLEDALGGARDILAELINENIEARAVMREFFWDKAFYRCKVIEGQEEAGSKYRDYFDWSEAACNAPSHRVLAMRRGEKEGFLSLRVLPEPEAAMALLSARFVKNQSPAAEQVRLAVEDSYKRLLSQAMETEIRLKTRQQAEAEAIKVFAQNLRQLLLAAPLGQKRVLAIDPGYRTGCKVSALSAQGEFLHHDVIHILTENQQKQALDKVRALCASFQIEAIAVGNGTASRETENLLRGAALTPPVIVVNESGASVYSASDIARQEFPDLDITVRGAISIGRRLMDPLAELVKIDPKSIGVGQYQHDVDQSELKQSLDDTVLSCVNLVGVELNTASAELLSFVSGLGPSLAKNIVSHRDKNGAFKSRQQLLDVPRLGPKAFEQAAGFLRISGGDHPLDTSAVHPESYSLVEDMAHDLKCALRDLLADASLRNRISPQKYVNDKFGLPTITDIIKELEKPGRDPRQNFELFSFSEHVNTPADLEPGMRLPGVVTNITNFGAFVDVGVHQDGLVHISNLSDNFVSDPHQVVKVQQRVMVTVLEVDIARNRISLSMRQNNDDNERAKERGASHNQNVKTGRPANIKKNENKSPAHNKKAENTSVPFNNPFAQLLQNPDAARRK